MSNAFDLIGVGAGPFNLSLAALIKKLANLKSRFYEQQANYQWHPGLLLKNSKLQVSFLKDLVSLADPTNYYSFINFLVKNKRIYRFVSSDFEAINRIEFNQYLQWVISSLDNITLGTSVSEVGFNDSYFIVQTSKEKTTCKNLILGSGQTPYIPSIFKKCDKDTVYHASNLLLNESNWQDKIIVVIGGGQSGAEAVLHILDDKNKYPKKLIWINNRHGFLPMDNTPFSVDYFSPSYLEYFYGLSDFCKAKALDEIRMTSDGILDKTLKELYHKIYCIKYYDKSNMELHINQNSQVVSVDSINKSWRLEVIQKEKMQNAYIDADMVLLATGYRQKIPDYIDSIKDKIETKDDLFVVNKDYSLNFDSKSGNKIYVQNYSKHHHGIADPNLSLAAYRSAVIINSLTNKEIYPVAEDISFIQWEMSNKKIECKNNFSERDDFFSRSNQECAANI